MVATTDALVGAGALVLVATVGVPAAIYGLGFTAAGVAAGSAAAAIQSSFGGVVVAGGYFASLQSAGVLGASLVTKVIVGTGSGAAAAGASNYIRRWWS